MGKKHRYLYQLFNDKGELVYRGTAKEIADRYMVDTKYIYHCFKYKTKMLREYTVTRTVAPDYWKPIDNEKYYYASARGIQEDYFSTKDFTRLARYNIGNCFKTKEEAYKHYDEIEIKLIKYYENT